jgi:hypothetical protein
MGPRTAILFHVLHESQHTVEGKVTRRSEHEEAKSGGVRTQTRIPLRAAAAVKQ